MSLFVLGAGGLRVHTSSLFLAVALLRLVIVPSLDTRKTPARGPLYFFSDLLGDGGPRLPMHTHHVKPHPAAPGPET